MSGSVNKVTLLGYLGADPQIRFFQNGGKAASFSLATSESWKDRETDERKERTHWHQVSILNEGLVGVAETYLKKGSRVYLEGQLETRKWKDAQSGDDRYATEVVLRPFRGELTLLDGPDRDQAPKGNMGPKDPDRPAEKPKRSYANRRDPR